MLDYKVIGGRIRKCRKEMHITQRMLAEKLDVSPEYMSRVETGTVSPSMTFLRRFCKVSGMTEMELFFELCPGKIIGVTELFFGISSDEMEASNKEFNEILLRLSPEKKKLLLELARAVEKSGL